MSLYATAPAAGPRAEAGRCSCVACRFGHGARHPVRPRRYISDMIDAQWQGIEPLMSWPAWLDGNSGRPEKSCRRQVVDALCYLADNGCTWRNLPADFPPWRTAHALFTRWYQDGDVAALPNALRDAVRRATGGRRTRPPRSSTRSRCGPQRPSAPPAGATTQASRCRAASAT